MRQLPTYPSHKKPLSKDRWLLYILCSIIPYLPLSIIAQDMPTTSPTAEILQTMQLKDLLFEVEEHYDVSILYRSEIVAGLALNADFEFESNIYKTLKKLLPPFQLQYQEINDNVFIIIAPKTVPSNNKGTVYGRITDITGQPLEGANIILKGTRLGAATSDRGIFEIKNVPAGNHILASSYVGFLTKEQKIKVEANANNEANALLDEDLLELKNVVVTGSRSNISNIESSIALTTLNTALLDKISPRSTADALQYIPGFYVESSGGEVSNNLFSRGMSAEGSFQYIALQEDGLPVYEAGNISWVSPDNFSRIDLSLKKIEALRGGSGNVFASNAPGGIINLLSQTGEDAFNNDKIKTKTRLQTSDFGQLRADVNIGGKLTSNTYFNIGGFYRKDKGIRHPGFTANKGGQLKMNLTRKFDKGHIRLYAKYLNDRNIFYLPIPLKNLSTPTPVNGFDANYGTMSALSETTVEFPTPKGVKSYDLKDGFHNHLGYIGTEISFEVLKDWKITNRNRMSYIQNTTDAIISVFEPIDAQQYAQEKMAELTGATTYRYNYANDSGSFPENTANGNGLIGEQGWWHNGIFLRNFINSLEITKKSDKQSFTGGIYFSEFSNETQRHWANLLLEVTDETAQRVNLDFYDQNGEWLSTATHNGFTTYQAFNTWENNIGKARVIALFADEQWTAHSKLTFNIGARYENLSASGRLENSEIYDLNPSNETFYNPVLRNIRYGNGTYEHYGWSFSDFALSMGINYNINENMSAYIRSTKGYRMPDFDNWQARQSEGGQTERVTLLESGYKYAAPKIAFFGALFYTSIRNQLTTDASIDTLGNVLPFRTRGSQTIGVELEATTRPIKNFKLDVKATLQKANYQVEKDQELPNLPPIDGNEVKRIPLIFFTLMPSYEYKRWKVFGTIQHFGHRFSDETNTADLAAFTSYNIGTSVDLSLSAQQHISFLLHVQNLGNGIGLTEGNPRIIGARKTATRLARPILGRSVIVSATLQL